MIVRQRLMRWMSMFVAIAVVAACGAGCGMDRKSQMQKVARDWCLTITASQVVPVYPLTEDLQPGDVFLVEMPIEEQRKRYDDKGFLPLDHHKARLTPEGYKDFYRDMFVMPLDGSGRRFTRELQRGSDGNANWTDAPAVAFPSYSVSVSRSSGFNAALPLYGIPVGLSLLDAQQGTASVTINSARTIGCDIDSLSTDLDVWAAKNQESLRHYARDVKARRPWWSKGPKRTYLRVVSRIYVTGGVDISVADARSAAGGIDAGLPRPVDLLDPAAPKEIAAVNTTRVENSRRAISTLNAGLAESLAPTRASGSNEGASAAEVDARTKAKLEQLKKAREARAKEVADAEAEVKAKGDAAKDAKAQLEESKSKLAAAEKALADALAAPAPDDAKVEEARAAADAARADVKAKEGAPPLAALADALGKSDAAKAALQQLTAVTPGASVRVTAASSRFVMLRQDFDPPLVIGYLGFDREILRDGEGVYLGPPVSTNSVLTENQAPREGRPFFTAEQGQVVTLRKQIEKREDANRRFDAAAASIGEGFIETYQAERGAGSSGKAAFNTTLLDYLETEPSGRGPRHAVVLRALRQANEANPNGEGE